MPLPLLSNLYRDGFDSVPYIALILKIITTITAIYYLKIYFSGATNKSERVLHGKVAIITGGTSGIGAEVARELALKGAQLVLLTRTPLGDPFLVDYIDDLRESTGNELIQAEEVNLADLHSIRQFATKWIDNAPPRRLDLLVLCADEMTPAAVGLKKSKDGAELMMAVNYLANFHLASILSPALRAQPPDRDVRVLVGMCQSYLGGDLGSLAVSPDLGDGKEKKSKKSNLSQTSKAPPIHPSTFTASKIYYTTKLALLTFSSAFQKHLTVTPRKDGLPPNVRVICVDPGWTRTPGMRRHLSRGSLWGLLFYLIMYPFWWIVLKSPIQGAQGFLFATMEAQLGAQLEAKSDIILVRECKLVPIGRAEVHDEWIQKRLWETTEQTIEALEKESALARARDKKAKSREEDDATGGDVVRTLNSKGKGVSFAQ